MQFTKMNALSLAALSLHSKNGDVFLGLVYGGVAHLSGLHMWEGIATTVRSAADLNMEHSIGVPLGIPWQIVFGHLGFSFAKASTGVTNILGFMHKTRRYFPAKPWPNLTNRKIL